MEQIIFFILANKTAIASGAVSVMEIFLRLYPTKKNYSLLAKIIYALNIVLPNRRNAKNDPVQYGKFLNGQFNY